MAVSQAEIRALEVVPGDVVMEVPEAGVAETLIVMMDFGVVEGVIELTIAGRDPPEGAVMIG